ncbi:14583_t:CDS:2, partial [Entrophospora sp. SA101]
MTVLPYWAKLLFVLYDLLHTMQISAKNCYPSDPDLTKEYNSIKSVQHT